MWRASLWATASLTLISGVWGTDILRTNGFSNCNNGTSTVKVNNVDISFDRSTNDVTFDVSGTSTEVQNVTASLVVTAYGVQVYQKDFDPCDASTKVDQLCPGEWDHQSILFQYVLTEAQFRRARFRPKGPNRFRLNT